jgi:hypothetical protein
MSLQKTTYTVDQQRTATDLNLRSVSYTRVISSADTNDVEVAAHGQLEQAILCACHTSAHARTLGMDEAGVRKVVAETLAKDCSRYFLTYEKTGGAVSSDDFPYLVQDYIEAMTSDDGQWRKTEDPAFEHVFIGAFAAGMNYSCEIWEWKAAHKLNSAGNPEMRIAKWMQFHGPNIYGAYLRMSPGERCFPC